jgi:ribosomal protein L11 methylase PrmA
LVNLFEECSSNYDNFKKIEGSEHIATFSSQLNFVEQLVRLKPETVLDYGTGIGTFIPIILNNSNASIYAVEKNDWCRNKFTKIIFNDNSTSASRVILLDALPILEFDIVIIDDEIPRSEIHKILMT